MRERGREREDESDEHDSRAHKWKKRRGVFVFWRTDDEGRSGEGGWLKKSLLGSVFFFALAARLRRIFIFSLVVVCVCACRKSWSFPTSHHHQPREIPVLPPPGLRRPRDPRRGWVAQHRSNAGLLLS